MVTRFKYLPSLVEIDLHDINAGPISHDVGDVALTGSIDAAHIIEG